MTPPYDFPVRSELDMQHAYCALVLKQRDVPALTLPPISVYRNHIYRDILGPRSTTFTQTNLQEERDDFEDMKVILQNTPLYDRMNAYCRANHLCQFCGRTLEGQRFICSANPEYIYCNANHHILDLRYHEGHARAAAAAAAASDEPLATEQVVLLEEAPEVVAGLTRDCDYATCQVMFSLKGLIFIGLKNAIEKNFTNILPTLCLLEKFVTDREDNGMINAILSARVPAENLAVLRRNLQRVLREVFDIKTFPCSSEIVSRGLNDDPTVFNENEKVDVVSHPLILAIKTHLIKFYKSFKCGDCPKRGGTKRGGSKRGGSKRGRRKRHTSRKL
jgi:hypothetical protein